MQLTCGEPYSPYSPFVKYTRQFKLDETCPATGRVKIVRANENIQEWIQRLGYASPHLVKKTFENSTQDYSGVRHEQEVMPKKLAVVRFPDLSDPMRRIRCNKETFYVDLLENTQPGKKRWGLLFYGVKLNLIAYYRLGSKDPTSTSNLYALGNFIAENGIPRMIITDSDGVLGAGKKWKQYLGQMFTPLHLSEPDKQNQNPVQRAIQNFKSGLSKIRNICGTGVLAYHCEAMEYLCSMNNYAAWESLGNRLLFEAFWGETPDISMIWFKFLEQVHYRNWTDKPVKVLMNTRRFLGFAWNIGDPMTFKWLQFNEDLYKRNIVVHRGVIVPRSLTEIGYNSALAPKSDAYFPDVQVECRATRKTTPLGHQGTVDPPNINITEGGGKRHNPSSSPPKSV